MTVEIIAFYFVQILRVVRMRLYSVHSITKLTTAWFAKRKCACA